MSEADLLQEKGQPTSKAVMGKRAIYRWADSEVTVIDGKVASISSRDRQREQAEREWSVKARAEQQAQIAAKSTPSAQQPIVIMGESESGGSFFARSRAAREAERKLGPTAAQRQAERDADYARRESLRVETNRLKGETRKAYLEGDRNKSRALAQEYKTKIRERDAVNNKLNNTPR